MLTQGQLRQELVRAMRTRRTIEHPLFDQLLHQGRDLTLIRLLSKQVYLLTREFERYVAGLFYNCPVRSFRQRLISNLYEEVTGHFSKTEGHLELMERFLGAIGVDPESITSDDALPTTRHLIDFRHELVRDRARFHRAAAAIMVTSEGQTIQRRDGKPTYQLLGDAYGLSEDDLAFFAVHAEEDTEHVKDGLELLCIVCTTEELQQEAITTARETSEAFWAFYDGVAAEFERVERETARTSRFPETLRSIEVAGVRP